MRFPPSLALAALLVALSALAAPTGASADTLYAEGAVFKDLEVPPGWVAVRGQVEREFELPDGSRSKVPLYGVRGRVVEFSQVDGEISYHFQVLLERVPAVEKKATFRFHPQALVIPRSAVSSYEKDFDSWLDMRLLLGNDDLRLGEALKTNPSLVKGAAGEVRRIVKLVEQGDDWVYGVLGYGGLEGSRLMTYRLGIRPGTWDALGAAQVPTVFQPGWLTYLVRMGAPKTQEEREQAALRAYARGELFPAVSLIPLQPSRDQVLSPADVAPSSQPDVLGANIRPSLDELLVAAAREHCWEGVYTCQLRDEGSRGAAFEEAIVKILRELCTWSKLPGSGPAIERARAIGREAREVIVSALERAMPGEPSPYDVMKVEIPAGTRRGPPERLEGAEHLPIDPSWVALVAMDVIQSCPEWGEPESPVEAKRLARALVRLSRPVDAEWQGDPRASDFGRQALDGSRVAGSETVLASQARITLGGAAREGLLSGRLARDGSRISSPYLPHLVDLLNDLEPSDRAVLLGAMTEAGVGDASLYTQVVERLFSIALDAEDWKVQLPSGWIGRSRRDAVAALGFLVRLDAQAQARGKALPAGELTPSQLVFERLNTVVDAYLAGRASERQKAFLELVKQLSLGSTTSDVRGMWLPEVARGRQLASDLTRGYTAYAKQAPISATLDGNRRVEKALLAEDRAAEAERVRVEVEEAARRAREVGRVFPQR